MATDIEKLVVQLNADVRNYQRDLLKAQGITFQQTRAIERRFSDMNRRLDAIGRAAANSIVAPLSGIAAALSVSEVMRYADAWTSAKNSLAVAGVVGKNQADVLDRLFQSAQKNATPIGALSDLFGKASQASDNLRASQEDLLKFSDGVAVSLRVAGASAESASGALQQLGQLLGSAKVQAEEFNSVNDGARPILLAVAKGLDEAGGSVNKLKQLVNDGKVSGKQFFDAFLKGLPAIEAMAANSTQTIAQGVTKVSNAMTKYVGETDSSLGASQRLVAGLNALADNFDETADAVLKLAAVIAGALVGRSIAGMLAKLALSGAVLLNFIKTLRAAQAVARSGLIFGGIASAAGPVGAAIGLAAAAIVAFGSSADNAVPSAKSYAEALDRVRNSAKDTAAAVDDATVKLNERQKNDLSQGLKENLDDLEQARAEVLKYLDGIQQNVNRRDVSNDELKMLADLSDQLARNKVSAEEADNAIAALANSKPKFQKMADQLKPLLQRMKELSASAKDLKTQMQDLGRTPNGLTHPSGDTVYSETEARRAYLSQRNADAARSEAEKEIDNRAKQIIADSAEKLGTALTEAAARVQAQAEIAAERTVKALDGSVSGFVDRTVSAESGGRADAKNPLSSATGVGQFIESTWLDLFRKNFPDRAASMSRESILALRTDAAISRQLIEAYARENAAVLQKAGVSVDEAALHLAHFLGPQGAAKVLSAAPGTPIAGLLPQSQIDANPSILGGGATVDTVRGYAERRAGMNTAGAQMAGARIDFEETLKQHQATIDALKAETGLRASLNPLVDDYGRALSTLQTAQELFNEAQQQGTEAGKELTSVQQLLNGDLSKLSPIAREQALAMRALAESQGQATAASNRLDVTQQQLAQSLQESSEFGKDVFGGFIRDLRDGASAGEALNGVLLKISDRLLEIGLNSLFDGGKAGSGGGIFGSLFSSLFAPSSFPAAPVGLYDSGGYTGAGGKKTPAGVVHKGEVVWSQKDVARAGGVGVVEAMRLGRRGYADGGAVLAAANHPALTGMARQRRDSVDVKVGIAADQHGNLQPFVESVAVKAVSAGIKHYDKNVAPGTAVKSVREHQMRNG